MAKITGNIVGLPNPKSDWNQADETKADFIKNKPTKLSQFENDANYVKDTEFATEVIKNTVQEYMLGIESEDVKKRPISTGVWEESVLGCIRTGDQLLVRIEKLEAQAGNFDGADAGVLNLKDLMTDKTYVIYVSEGKLKMSESEKTGKESMVLKDASTGLKYCLYISDGNLEMKVSDILRNAIDSIELKEGKKLFFVYVSDGSLKLKESEE